MNKFIFTGNLGKDSELQFIPNSGKAILKFSVGVARGFKREDGTDWINCALFGDRAEKLSAYLVKGTKVLVEGAVRINPHEKDGVKRYFTEVLVNNVEFIGGKSEVAHDSAPASTNTGVTEVDYNDSSDELPF